MGAFPYESQWGDLGVNVAVIEAGVDPAERFDWRAEGYPNAEEYRLWSRNVCGLACLRSVLQAWRGIRPRMHDLVVGAQEHGALSRHGETINGLYYRPMLLWAERAFNLTGEILEDMEAAEVPGQVAGGQVFIGSVSSEIRYPLRPNQRRGGHLVLVHAADNRWLTFHNPSGVRESAGDARLSVETFSRFFAGRGFTLRADAGD